MIVTVLPETLTCVVSVTAIVRATLPSALKITRLPLPASTDSLKTSTILADGDTPVASSPGVKLLSVGDTVSVDSNWPAARDRSAN